MKWLASVLIVPLALSAADFWESKPYTDWSDKEVQKLVTNSPWAKKVSATMAASGSRTPSRSSSDQTANSGGNGFPTARGSDANATPGFGRPGSDPSVGLEQARRADSSAPGVPAIVRWMTAQPLREAQVRAKYGKDAESNPDAQEFLARQPKALYLVSVAGLPGLFVGREAGDKAKEQIIAQTTLAAKGKDPLRPVAVEFAPDGLNIDVLIGFPKAMPFTIEDQEVEFSSQIGTLKVEQKFKLKDMMFKGKLEM